jgi:acyl-CoA hydrolase
MSERADARSANKPVHVGVRMCRLCSRVIYVKRSSVYIREHTVC